MVNLAPTTIDKNSLCIVVAVYQTLQEACHVHISKVLIIIKCVFVERIIERNHLAQEACAKRKESNVLPLNLFKSFGLFAKFEQAVAIAESRRHRADSQNVFARACAKPCQQRFAARHDFARVCAQLMVHR